MARKPRGKVPGVNLVKSEPEDIELLRRTSMIMVRVGDRHIDLPYERGCPVCLHPARAKIEEMIIFGDGYPLIAKWASNKQVTGADGRAEDWPKITSRNITNHFKDGHIPSDAVVRDALNKQLTNDGKDIDYEKLYHRIIDSRVIVKFGLNKVMEGLAKGELKPTLREGIQLLKLDATMTAAAQGEREEQKDLSWMYEEIFAIQIALAKEIMTEAQWDRYENMLLHDQRLRTVHERIQPSVVDAEIVKETSA